MPQEASTSLPSTASTTSHPQSHASVLIFILMVFFGIIEVLLVPTLEGHAQDVTRIVLYVSFTYANHVTNYAYWPV